MSRFVMCCALAASLALATDALAQCRGRGGGTSTGGSISLAGPSMAGMLQMQAMRQRQQQMYLQQQYQTYLQNQYRLQMQQARADQPGVEDDQLADRQSTRERRNEVVRRRREARMARLQRAREERLAARQQNPAVKLGR